MAQVPMQEFIRTHRNELISRCRAKSAKRAASAPSSREPDQAVARFLDAIAAELDEQSSHPPDTVKSAGQHVGEPWVRGLTLPQVVNDCSDVCQAVTDLAVDLEASIEARDFRALNRCLDSAIAGAVTEHARQQVVTHEGEADDLRTMVESALAAFDVMQRGHVGVGGSTGAILHHSLLSIRAFADGTGHRLK
jgi:hypothetical protein